MPRIFRNIRYSVDSVLHPEREQVDTVQRQRDELEHLQQLLAQWSASLQSFAAVHRQLHAQLAAVYPASGRMAGALSSLATPSTSPAGGPMTTMGGLEDSVPLLARFIARWSAILSTEVQTPLFALSANIKERSILHREVGHYETKVGRMRMRSTDSQKIQVNEAKLSSARASFRRLSDTCQTQLDALPRTLDERLTPLIQAFLGVESALFHDASARVEAVLGSNATATAARLPAALTNFDTVSTTLSPEVSPGTTTAAAAPAPQAKTSAWHPPSTEPTPSGYVTALGSPSFALMAAQAAQRGATRGADANAAPMAAAHAKQASGFTDDTTPASAGTSAQVLQRSPVGGMAAAEAAGLSSASVPDSARGRAVSGMSSASASSAHDKTPETTYLCVLSADLSDGATLNVRSGDVITASALDLQGPAGAADPQKLITIMTADGPAMCPRGALQILWQSLRCKSDLAAAGLSAAVRAATCTAPETLMLLGGQPSGTALVPGDVVDVVLSTTMRSTDEQWVSKQLAHKYTLIGAHCATPVGVSPSTCIGWVPTSALRFDHGGNKLVAQHVSVAGASASNVAVPV